MELKQSATIFAHNPTSILKKNEMISIMEWRWYEVEGKKRKSCKEEDAWDVCWLHFLSCRSSWKKNKKVHRERFGRCTWGQTATQTIHGALAARTRRVQGHLVRLRDCFSLPCLLFRALLRNKPLPSRSLITLLNAFYKPINYSHFNEQQQNTHTCRRTLLPRFLGLP